MKFNIGPFVYTVVIGETPPGTRGLWEYEARLITISPLAPLDQRFDVLVHELTHAWRAHFPRPQTEEEHADAVVAIAKSTLRDLNAQGGRARLAAMFDPANPPVFDDAPELPEVEQPADGPTAANSREPGELRYVALDSIDGVDLPAHAKGGRARCGQCEGTIADGSIVTSAAKWSPTDAGLVVRRQAYCTFCHVLIAWTEGANHFGHPNGNPTKDPVYISDPQRVAEFLAEHPHARAIAG